MRIRMLGGFAVEHDGTPIPISGSTQRGLLFRLALDPGAVVTYRAIAEDLWEDLPENPRASLQSLVSRLRPQLPAGILESAPGGYRLAIARGDVDAVRFEDLVASARADPAGASGRAAEALALWSGDPWTPGPGYDWLERDLAADRADALRLAEGPAPLARSTVPAPLTALLGRESELGSVDAQLSGSRLVTVLGTGGAGKTRLAVEVARSRPSVLVELAPAGAEEVWQAVLGAVGREVRLFGELGTGPSAAEVVVETLAGRDALLVLDNCEHVIAAAAEVAAELLSALPRLRILTTSREPLGVPGEAFVPLGPLDADAAALLFDERVRQARGSGLAADEADAAARIRDRLDGLPLALELAAAKARTMTLDEIADGLDDRFRLLTGGLRTVLPRHQTLRALVDWSWQLLAPGERRALTVIAAYPAGIAARDADGVSAAHGIRAADLDALVDKSLLRRAAGRFRALETIREYGLARLAESGEVDAVRSAQTSWLVEASVREDPRLRSDRCLDALAWFDTEDDNIAAALRWSARNDRGEELVRLTAANAWYWILRDRNEDAMTWVGAAAPFAAAQASDAALLIETTGSMIQGFVDSDEPPDIDDSRLAGMRERLEAAGPRDNELLQVFPVLARAAESMMAGRPVVEPTGADDAGAPLTRWAAATIAAVYAAFAQNQGDIPRLGRHSERAVEEFEEIGDLWGLSLARQMRSQWLVLQGRLEEALELTDRATRDLRRITSVWDQQQQQSLAVQLLERLGRGDEALARAQGLLASARESGSPGAIVQATITATDLLLGRGDVDEARRVAGEAAAAVQDLPRREGQLIAGLELMRAALGGPADREAVREHLLRAVEAAIESHDQPVMARVALGVGGAALDESDLATAAGALRLARALRGAPDPTDPREARLVAALERAGDPVEESPALDRAAAARELDQILRR